MTKMEPSIYRKRLIVFYMENPSGRFKCPVCWNQFRTWVDNVDICIHAMENWDNVKRRGACRVCCRNPIDRDTETERIANIIKDSGR